MTQYNTKEEYARCYDRHAARLYRFALYILGDARRAASAVSAAFVDGWQKGLSLQDEDAFFEDMLRLVWRACERSAALRGAAYSKGVQRAAKGCDTRFLAALSSMQKEKRGALVLAALLGDDTSTLLRVIPGAPARQPAAALSRNPA